MSDTRHKMTAWYDPGLLLRTVLRVAISTLFGAFADRRELVAAVNPIPAAALDETHDYSKKAENAEFWLDFVADTGDGWNSTHAVAQLIAEPSLILDKNQLPRAKIVILGGDQVYPTASIKDYQEHFIAPWDEAARKLGHDPDKPGLGDLFAVPGNHDWYDGLIAFSHIFARRNSGTSGTASIPRKGKVIGGRQTAQVRSYFALKLPYDWWLWGTDSQLEGYIDQPQVDFFSFVASKWMAPRSKLILCTGQPSWSYVDTQNPASAFNSFSFLSRLARSAEGPDGKEMGHDLRLVLSGDAHHYSRYTEGNCQYVTAGGGGAFLHPTHHLREEIAFDWTYPAPDQPYKKGEPKAQRKFQLADRLIVAGEDDPAMLAEEKAVYPARSTSKAMTWRNLLFPVLNAKFTVLLIGLYALLGWGLERRLSVEDAPVLLDMVTASGQASFGEALRIFAALVLSSPLVFVTLGAVIVGLIYFADAPKSIWRRIAMGATHGIVQIAFFLLSWAGTFWLFARSPMVDWSSGLALLHIIAADMLAAVVSGFAGALVFGIYLLISLRFLNRHWNEAYSSLRIEGFKNFVRIRITEDGLDMFAVGLDTVPKKDGLASALKPRLIERKVHIQSAKTGGQ